MRVAIIFTFLICSVLLPLSSAEVLIGFSELPDEDEVIHIEVDRAEITCDTDDVCIDFNTDWLESRWGISDGRGLEIGNDCNSTTFFNSTHIVICSTIEDLLLCNTGFTINDTHATYSNNLTVNTYRRTQIIVHATLNWSCSYPTELIVSTSYLPNISPVNIFLGKKSGEGKFRAAMFLFEDDNFSYAFDNRPRLEMTDRLRVNVQLLDGPEDARMQVIQCWGSPGDSTAEQRFVLIDDYCPSQDSAKALVALHNNGVSHHVKFIASVFRFIDHEEVFLYCHARVCFENCEKKCNASVASRAKRNVVLQDDLVLSVGPIIMSPSVPYIVKSMKHLFNHVTTIEPLSSTKEFVEETVLGLKWTVLSAIVAVLAFSTLVFVIITFVVIRKRLWRSRNIDIKTETMEERTQRINRQLSRRVTINSGFGIPLDIPEAQS